MQKITKEEYIWALKKKIELRKLLFDVRYKAEITEDYSEVGKVIKEFTKVKYIIAKYENDNKINEEKRKSL